MSSEKEASKPTEPKSETPKSTKSETPKSEDSKKKSLEDAQEEINKLLDQMKIADFPLPKEKKIVEVKSDASVKDAVEILMKYHILSAPVVDIKAKEDADWLDKYLSLVDMMDVAHFVMSLIDNPEKKVHSKGYAGLLEENKKITMTPVADIAGTGGNNPFVALDLKSSLRDAMILLGKQHLYRIAIIDGDKQQLVNIITQSAIIKTLNDNLSKFSAITDKTLKELGLAEPKKVLQAPIHAPAISAFKMITENKIGAIPVVGVTGNVVANISARDIRAVLNSPSLYGALFNPLSSFLSLAYQDKVDVMAPAITCQPTHTLKHVIQQLCISHIHRMYIVDEKQKLISVISLTDVISVIATEPKNVTITL